jgi:iron complex transport system permease protein
MSVFAAPERRWLGLAVVAASVLVAGAIAAGVGSSRLGIHDVVTALLGGGDAATRGIVIDFRLARVLLAACVGAALATAGASYQAVLRNPLADPFILGVSGGAALGAVLFIAISPASGLGDSIARPAAAFLGAVVTLLVLFGLARFQGRTETTALLLTGIVLNALDSAIIQFFVSAGDPARFQGTMSYLMGSMNAPSWQALAIVAALSAAGIALLLTQAHTLNLLTLGDEEAAQLGLSVDRARWTVVLAASLVTAAAVAFTGIIGFVGLIVPHAMRALFGPDHRVLLPASALAGAATLMLADAAARTFIAPAELPVGVVTALIGGPFFLILLMKRLRAS